MTATAATTEATSAKLDIGGGSVHYLRGGKGPPLLFLHAAGGVGLWTAFHTALAEHYEVFAPDHPGFGGSDELAEVEDMGDLVYHYLDVMQRLGLDRPVVVGASFGGWIAAELAVHSPERVRELVLLSAAGLRLPAHPVTDLFLLKPDQLGPALFADPAVAAAAFPAEPDIEFILDSYRNMTALARFGWYPFLANPKLERRLHRISAPTLVVWPDADRIVPLEHGRRYAERIPNARLQMVENCGHALHLERPEECARVVVEFLASQNRSEGTA